eukprot:TRINITY_DN1737_c0_g1_i11.p1 TRINITY_DN1737_c0_g1~~TRINITY_DN1737_c0_g1_i11.p1  ORF type:complete len:350 (-),score=75.04 TRINITY_DN1737_c0_g1_i11:112-1161(-)
MCIRDRYMGKAQIIQMASFYSRRYLCRTLTNKPLRYCSEMAQSGGVRSKYLEKILKQSTKTNFKKWTLDQANIVSALKDKNSLMTKYYVNKIGYSGEVVDQITDEILENSELTLEEKQLFLTLLIETFCVQNSEDNAVKLTFKCIIRDIELDLNVYRTLIKTLKRQERDSSYADILFQILIDTTIPNRPIIKDLFAIADASDDDNLKTKIFAYLEDLMNASEEIDFIEKQNIQKLIWELISSQEKAKVDGSLYPEKKKAGARKKIKPIVLRKGESLRDYRAYLRQLGIIESIEENAEGFEEEYESGYSSNEEEYDSEEENEEIDSEEDEVISQEDLESDDENINRNRRK